MLPAGFKGASTCPALCNTGYYDEDFQINFNVVQIRGFPAGQVLSNVGLPEQVSGRIGDRASAYFGHLLYFRWIPPGAFGINQILDASIKQPITDVLIRLRSSSLTFCSLSDLTF